MHLHLILTHLLSQTSTSKPGSSSSKNSSSFVPILILVAVFGVAWFFLIRPRSQRLRQQQAAVRQLGVGDEVISAGGIYGKVVAIDADAVEVEVAPGVVMTFTRRAINPRQASGPAGGGAPARASEPVDEPWEKEPDGPGDTAASDDPTASSSHWDEPSGDDPSGPRPSGG
jgi:preprotein translocase subunit YajC